MINEAAINHIKDIIYENNTIKPSLVVFEQEIGALRMAIKALETADRYKWHDLRKDPTDLPDANFKHQVMFSWNGGYGRTWYECGWFYEDEQEDEPYFSSHEVHMFIGDDFRHVTAWRYIEPFTEDKE